MNKTALQNGASSSPLYNHRSTPSTPTSQPQGGRSAHSPSKVSSVADTPVSSYKIRESEMFQSREVLLKMLQSPPVVYVPGSGCSLPHQEDGKACSKSDGSHCSRCINYQPPSMVHMNSELSNEEWSPRTKNDICVPPTNVGDRQSISCRETGKKHFQPHRGLVNVPCDEENHVRKRSFEKTRLLFPTTARCRTCEGNSQPFYPEELHLRATRCQHFLPENQKHFNRSHCFSKEILPSDRSSVLLHKERQTEDNGAINSNRESPRNDGGSLNHRYLPLRFYHSCDSRPDQPPTSNQTLAWDHRGMETSTDEVPVDFRPGECYVNDASHNIIDRSHLVASSTTQGKPSEPSPPLPKGCGFTPFYPSDESLQDQGREERNTRLEKDSGKHNYACPHCPNQSSQEECTPVIVHCYSLSKPGSNSDSEIMNEHKSGESLTVSEGTQWVPGGHSHCTHEQYRLRSHKPVNRLHFDEHVLYDAPAHSPRCNTFAHNHRLKTQTKHAMNEAPTTDVGVNDEKEQNGSVLMLPSRVHERFRPPMNCRCLQCPPCQHENGYGKKYIQAARRIPYPYSEHCPEPKKTSESVSQIHISSDYHGKSTLPEADRETDVEPSRETFCNWPNKPVSNGRRPTFKIRDYYEERRILVEKFYQDIPGSIEGAESEDSSDHHKGHRHRHPASAEVSRAPSFDDSPFHVGLHQRDITIGSKKRKNRTPRPQRVKTDDPAQFAGSEVKQVQYEEDRSKESFKNRRHQQRNLSCQGTSIPSEACRKTRENVEVRGMENETRSCEDVQATVPVHLGWVRRCDDNISKNTPSRSRFYRREISTDTWPQCHPSSEVSKIIKGCEPFLEVPRVPPCDVPSFRAISNRRRPTNHFSLEHQNNAYYQSKIQHQQDFVNTHETASKCPDNVESEWNVTQEHWPTPARREDSKAQLETFRKVGAGHENSYGRCPSRMRMTSCGPSQHSIPNRGSVTFQIEMEFEPEHSSEAMPDYSERHAASAMDKPQSEDSSSPTSSLLSDHGSVPSTTLEDSDVLQKTHSSDQPQEQAYAPKDGEILRETTEEQNVTVSESRNLFLQTQEMYGNYMPPSIKERRFVCRFCCKKFAHFSTLQNHVRTHTGDKPFQCKFCSRRFAQSGVLKAHLRTHTGDKPFVCMYCGKTFAQSTTLTNHLRTHTGQKPYICNYCGKSFSQPSTLRKHELSHTKERPYSCKFCGKAFAQQSTLTNHMRSHTGQRPYKCHFCEKRFAQLSTLDRHLRLHSSVIPKPHQCQYCSKSFSYFSNLASHIQVHEQAQQSKVV